MKKLIVVLVLCGCASPEGMLRYYRSVDKINEYRTRAVEQQTRENAAAKVNAMIAFSTAMESATKTKDPSDNAVIALAWGFHMASTPVVTIPPLQYPEPPVNDVDRIRALTPILSYVLPFLGTWWWSGDTDKSENVATTTYNLSGANAQINKDSRNAGSFNAAGGNQTNESALDNSIDTLLSTFACGGEGEESCSDQDVILEIPSGPTIIYGERYTDLQECLATPPAGIENSVPMWSQGCSCTSHFSGKC